MKRIITLLSLVAICFSNTLSAQKLNYETTSPWFWGMNVGAAWNTTDVQNKTQAGWGFILGRSFNYDAGNVFSFDLRGRYLGGSWMGQDFDTTGFLIPNKTLSSGATNYDSILGYGINNFKTKVHAADLELVIHLNKFTARTGLDPYIFGGVGFTWYRARGNLLDDATGLTYDYGNLSDFHKNNIDFLLDDSYETNLDSSSNRYNIGFMPSLGFGLGYHFGPRFSMGIEHKTTFTLLDHFDGYNNPNNAPSPIFGAKKDLYHYTSIYFKHHFKLRGEEQQSTIDNNNPNTNSVVTGGSGGCQKPIIRFNSPANNSTVTNPNLTIQADVAHVPNRNNVTLTINGNTSTNFTYTTNTNKLTGNGLLNVGQNTIVITAENSCGITTETIYVNYQLDCQTPIIRFTNPVNSGTNVSSGTYYVTADVMNLTQNQGLTFRVNGVNVTAFSFNPQTGKFSSTVNLLQGQNTFELNASNNCGNIAANTQVNYSTNCPAPVIAGMSAVNGATVANEQYTIVAQFQNITTANQVTVTVNGVIQNQGQFNSSTGQYQNTVLLSKGQNTIEISTSNNCGRANQTVLVNYQLDCQTPIVRFTNPLNSGTTVSAGTFYVTADVLNMTSSQGLTFRVNGINSTNFNFVPQTGKFSATVNLTQGLNTFELNAVNNCGNISATSQVTYTINCPVPVISGINTANGTTVENAYFTLSTQIQNITSASQVSVTVNGVSQNQGQFNASNGNYQNTLVLIKGQNTIEITAINNCGRATQMLVVNYSERCIAPVVSITNPAISGSSVENANYTFSATITNMTSSQGISLKLNGQFITNYQFNTQTNQLIANLVLQQGSNMIELNATNNCGNGIGVTAINYNYVCPKPTIQFISPNGNASANQQTYIVQAIVSNANTSNPVQFKVNGVLTQGTFNPANGMFTATIQLVSGSNQLELTATNNCGSTTTTASVVYREVVVIESMPVITMTGTCDATVEAGVQSISGLITGITNQSQVTIRLNDVVVNNVTYAMSPSGLNFAFNITTALDPSVYVIVVTATNSAGTVTKTCVIKVNQIIDNNIEICVTENGKKVTRTIKQSQWPAYQAQGATLGRCVVIVDNDIEICVTENGKKVNKTIKQSQWVTYQAQGATLGKCPVVVDNDITICVLVGRIPTTRVIKESEWPTYQAQGATLGACPVIDNDIEICVTENGKKVNKTIKQSQWVTYQAQGATLGKCPVVVDNDITICVLVGRVPTTRVIKESEWPTYQAQGATLGACPVIDNDIEICVTENGKKVNKTIKQSQWPAYQAQGATYGKCPVVVDNDITICVLVGRIPTTKVIKESEWPTYQSQGATLGKCPVIVDNDIEICVTENGKKVNKTIKQSQWVTYQAQGATLGKCPVVVDNDITICVLVGRIPTTKVIKESEWPAYQAQGATLGACPVIDNDIEICVTENGKKVNKTIKQSQWVTYQAQGATLGKCPVVVDNDITICVLVGRIPTTKVIKESEWPAYQSQGATLGACPVIDKDIEICVTENGKKVNKTIKQSQWVTYQAQGATLGKCPVVVDKDITICVLVGRIPTTKVIKESEWPAYQAQGATLGACPVIVDNDIEICVTENGKKVNKTIKQSQWPTYQAQGATLGKCPVVVDNDITICVLVGRIPTTKVIKESEWPAYQAQGATLGKCPVIVDNDIEICVTENGKKVNKTIKQSQWITYQAQGATLGKCPVLVDNDITICVLVGRIPTTKVIKESEWPAYQAQGASLGACPGVDNDITICVTGVGRPTTMVIKESEWPTYQAQGATLGACPDVVPAGVRDSNIVICVAIDGVQTTKTIRVSEWSTYEALGATLGECSNTKRATKVVAPKPKAGEIRRGE